MGIVSEPGKKPLVPPPPPSWGEVAPAGETVLVVRFTLADRIVSYPFAEFRKWEHVTGPAECLMIHAGGDQLLIEETELAAIRLALDLGRLRELKPNFEGTQGRPGPRVRRISLESP